MRRPQRAYPAATVADFLTAVLRAVAGSLEEAGDRLFTFSRLDPSQWKSARTTSAVERLIEEFRRRIRTRIVLPSAEIVPMPFRALLASGRIRMRKVDGWETLAQSLEATPLDQAARPRPTHLARRPSTGNFHHIRATTDLLFAT